MSGSRAESISEKGAAHLISVAAYTGTTKRSGLRLARDLENLGAIFGASADREKVAIFLKHYYRSARHHALLLYQITFDLTVLPEKASEALGLVAEAIVSPATAPYLVRLWYRV